MDIRKVKRTMDLATHDIRVNIHIGYN